MCNGVLGKYLSSKPRYQAHSCLIQVRSSRLTTLQEMHSYLRFGQRALFTNPQSWQKLNRLNEFITSGNTSSWLYGVHNSSNLSCFINQNNIIMNYLPVKTGDYFLAATGRQQINFSFVLCSKFIYNYKTHIYQRALLFLFFKVNLQLKHFLWIWINELYCCLCLSSEDSLHFPSYNQGSPNP